MVDVLLLKRSQHPQQSDIDEFDSALHLDCLANRSIYYGRETQGQIIAQPSFQAFLYQVPHGAVLLIKNGCPLPSRG